MKFTNLSDSLLAAVEIVTSDIKPVEQNDLINQSDYARSPAEICGMSFQTSLVFHGSAFLQVQWHLRMMDGRALP